MFNLRCHLLSLLATDKESGEVFKAQIDEA